MQNTFFSSSVATLYKHTTKKNPKKQTATQTGFAPNYILQTFNAI